MNECKKKIKIDPELLVHFEESEIKSEVKSEVRNDVVIESSKDIKVEAVEDSFRSPALHFKTEELLTNKNTNPIIESHNSLKTETHIEPCNEPSSNYDSKLSRIQENLLKWHVIIEHFKTKDDKLVKSFLANFNQMRIEHDTGPSKNNIIIDMLTKIGLFGISILSEDMPEEHNVKELSLRFKYKLVPKKRNYGQHILNTACMNGWIGVMRFVTTNFADFDIQYIFSLSCLVLQTKIQKVLLKTTDLKGCDLNSGLKMALLQKDSKLILKFLDQNYYYEQEIYETCQSLGDKIAKAARENELKHFENHSIKTTL